MDFHLKTYKHFKIKHYFKTIHYFFFFQGISLKNENRIKILQILVKHNLKYYRIYNKLMIRILKNSIFKNLITLIHGPIILLNNNTGNLTFKELKNVNPLLNFLGFRLNNKVYSRKQVKNLKKMSYLENIFFFYNSIKILIKMPYYKLKRKK